MKIVYMSTSIIPSRAANSVHVMKMCHALAKSGHQVTLLAMSNARKDEIKFDGDPYDFYGVSDTFEVKQRKVLPVKYLRWALYSIQAFLFAVRKKPDLVYARDLLSARLCALAHLSVVYESHAPEDCSWIKHRLFKSLIGSHDLKRVVVITKALKKHYDAVYPQLGTRLLVVPDGADPVPDDIKPVLFTNKSNRLQTGYVGSFYRGKGLEIISKLAHLCQNSDFHIVGGCPSAVAKAKEMFPGLKNVFFYGHVPHSEVSSYLLACDILLLPNQTRVETYNGRRDIGQWTSPLKAFEYMAAGKAIICSDIPVLKEVFIANENAVLCPPDDAAQWALALLHLERNGTLREKLGRQAKECFSNLYSWEMRAKIVLNELFITFSANA